MTFAQETAAMTTIHAALDKIDDEEGRFRVLRWAVDAYRLPSGPRQFTPQARPDGAGGSGRTTEDIEYASVSAFVARRDAANREAEPRVRMVQSHPQEAE